MTHRPLPFAILLVLLVLLTVAAQAAPPRPRPYSGCGVLALSPEPGADRVPLVVYQEPGVARLAELDGSALSRLAGDGRQPLVAVSARRGRWTRLVYDEAGREGWIDQARAWQYLSWQEYLPGRWLRILPGMKKDGYALRSGPGAPGPEVGNLSRDQAVRVLQVENDWVRLQAPAGWFRWRDGDGRITVSLAGEDGAKQAEKR